MNIYSLIILICINKIFNPNNNIKKKEDYLLYYLLNSVNYNIPITIKIIIIDMNNI